MVNYVNLQSIFLFCNVNPLSLSLSSSSSSIETRHALLHQNGVRVSSQMLPDKVYKSEGFVFASPANLFTYLVDMDASSEAWKRVFEEWVSGVWWLSHRFPSAHSVS